MDDQEIRLALQRMAGYREVCQAVRSGAGHTTFNALLWLGLTAVLYQALGVAPLVLVYLVLGLAELAVGLWKWWVPSVEAVLADGLVLLGFGAFVLGRQLMAFQGWINEPVRPISVFLGAWWVYDAFKAVRAYGALRRAFPDRPTRDQIAWFNGLVREIRASHPEADESALNLPTRPAWKAKLLGTTAFFVSAKGESVRVAGPDDFGIGRENEDGGTGRRLAQLWIYDRPYPPFEIDDASWKNYRVWLEGPARAG